MLNGGFSLRAQGARNLERASHPRGSLQSRLVYLVDPVSSHMLVLKIKPCKPKLIVFVL